MAQPISPLTDACLMGNYGARDLTLVRGEGVRVWDNQGNAYYDLLSGLGVNNLGHCHPRVVAAIQKQAETLLHVSNLYLIEPQMELAALLVENSCADKAFFCNSGAEANEAAIKMARRYSFNNYGEERGRIVSLNGSFHGRTLGALTATGQPKYHEGFQPLIPGFSHVPINDADALNAACDDGVCAVMIEPVQGEGGIHPCSAAYLQAARAICDERGILLIFDEVQCGLGRSGHLFASDEFGVEPDLIVLAKSLAGGVPIGALLAKNEPASVFVPGTHAATFGGNPLSCAAGVAAFSTLLEEGLAERSHALGQRFRARLAEIKAKTSRITDVRGMGLMIGVEFDFPVAEIVKSLRADGFIAGMAGPNVLRFLPPLIVEESTLDQAAQSLEDRLK